MASATVHELGKRRKGVGPKQRKGVAGPEFKWKPLRIFQPLVQGYFGQPIRHPMAPNRTRYLGAHGGRGSGKSRFCAEFAVTAMIENPSLRVAAIREVQRTLAMSSKLLVEDCITRMGVQHCFDIQGKLIHRVGGDGLMIFEGMQNHTADSIKSLEGFKLAWVEEAQNLSARSLELMTPTFRGGATMLFSWNPASPDDPVDQLFRGPVPHPSMACVEANYLHNPYFPDDLRMDMERDKLRNYEKYLHVWMGAYQTMSEARVFRNWRVEDFDTPDDAVFYHGADWGFSIDPTALVRCWFKGRTLYVDAEAVKIGVPLDHSPHFFAGMDDPGCNQANPTALADIRGKGIRYAGIPGCRKWPIIADSARPETIDYMKRHGFPRIQPAIKGARSVEEGIEFLQSYDIVVHPRCTHTADELAHYSYEVDDKTGLVIPKLKDATNHLIDSLRYATEPLRKPSMFRISQEAMDNV